MASNPLQVQSLNVLEEKITSLHVNYMLNKGKTFMSNLTL